MLRMLLFLLGSMLLGCSRSVPSTHIASPQAVSTNAIENAFLVREGIYSGGSPEGDASFAELQKLGIRTIITVDGAQPDVFRAERLGMRYVQLPVGYDGIPQAQAERIAKAVRDLPRPIYIHCHHGKHRGPAAVAAALLCIDPTYTADDATKWMNLAGTDPKYRGLIELPQRLKRPTTAELDRVDSNFSSIATVPDFIALMVKIDERWDALKASQKKQWTIGEPIRSAVLLAEHYRESHRTNEAMQKGESFQKLLQQAERDAEGLHKALQAKDTARANAAYAIVESGCSSCHKTYRD